MNTDRANSISFVISGAKDLVTASKQEVVDLIQKDLHHLYPSFDFEVSHAVVRKEPMATWVAPIGNESGRKSQKTDQKNIFLAGDWTNTGLPGTIESAVKSGHLAAHYVNDYVVNSRF